MSKLKLLFCLGICFIYQGMAQTADLSVAVEAQDLNGTEISQAHIFQEFQYVITIINSGNEVNNASFSQIMDPSLTVLSYESQNAQGGATDAGSFTLAAGNTLLGTVATMPNNSSVQIKVVVKAPIDIGGIATDVTVFVPSEVTDTDPSNNQSIISIDITDVDIDFTVDYTQVNPALGTGISAWGDMVTYQFTVTNNSIIEYPLSGVKTFISLSSNINFGSPVANLVSLNCIGATNGTECPNITVPTTTPSIINAVEEIVQIGGFYIISSGGSLTFEVTYQYLQPSCSFDPQTISVNSFVELVLGHDNISSNLSNQVNTELLLADPCDVTDICIETVQIDPDVNQTVGWGEEVTFITTACNNGPLDAPMRFFLQNLSPVVSWDILSVTCIDATGGISCDDITLSVANSGVFWESSSFTMPVGATITVETVAVFLEPECAISPQPLQAHIRSGTNLLSNVIFDNNIQNSVDSDYVNLPSAELCPNVNLSVSKTQIDPVPPIGTSVDNTAEWGAITYEITIANTSNDDDAVITLFDYYQSAPDVAIGTLTSLECVSTTGTAVCQPLNNVYLDEPLDGVPQDGNLDLFWEIVADDNWTLPAQSSITFQATVFWEPTCSFAGIPVNNNVEIDHADTTDDPNPNDNAATVVSYFASCVDLVVQTFPEFPAVNVNQPFNWVVDVANSETSSTATNIPFESLLDDVFIPNGTPTCQVISGTASCISNFDETNNLVTGTIPIMEPGSTIRVTIPVLAPNTGGAFTNTAQAIPFGDQNEEITPETNISISNVQVLAPELIKSFEPAVIIAGNESILSFTVNNTDGSPGQTQITFMDNLPSGITLAGSPYWVNANGCTANFVGNSGDTAIGVTDLEFPVGVASCTFAVVVTSDIIGSYVNAHDNFSDQANIDTSQTMATLEVLEDTSDVDIAITKTVTPELVGLGEPVTFTVTMTNEGTTTGTGISVTDILPNGYTLIEVTSSEGTFDSTNGLWSVEVLESGSAATLTMHCIVNASVNLLNTASLTGVNEIDRDDTNNEDSAFVELNNCLTVPQGISPNTDGFNDALVIPCIEDYPNSLLKIYNRYGTLIYEMANYDNSWTGIPNKGLLKGDGIVPVGTYFYVLEINASTTPIVGWVYINY